MKTTYFLLALALFLHLGTPPLTAQLPTGEGLPVIEKELPNGLRLLVLRRSGAPTVAFVTQYRVGSVHEEPGRSGIAHLLEHMLFKGTKTIGTIDHSAELELFPRIDAVNDSIRALRSLRTQLASLDAPTEVAEIDARVSDLAEYLKALEDSARAFIVPNDFDRILSRHGARGLNATTTYESTTYFVELPSNRAELWFILESDRLQNPVFREFYAERDVVAEERRMRIESDPGGRLWEELMATAFRVHPYGRPVIGTMEEIQGLSRRDAEEYFQRYYGPNNAVVAIVGDIDPDEIIALAERYLGPIPPGEEPPPVLEREPRQWEERRVEVEYDAEPQLLIGWHVPPREDEDYPALSILAHLLSGGNTSRIYRRLVLEERLAHSVSTSIQPGELYPQLFTIGVAPRAPHTTEELEAVIYEEIERLKRDPPEYHELERIRNQLEAGEVRRLRSNLGLAFQLAGSTAYYDDWRATFRFTRRLQEVEPGDIQRVARRYLRPTNRTVARLVRPGAETADHLIDSSEGRR